MFSTEIFMARGHSYLWTPWLVWTHVISNTTIGVALLVAAVVILRRGQPTAGRSQSGRVVVAGFALLLGTAHLLDVWVIWTPIYGVDAIVRSAGALAGIGAAVALGRARS